MNFKNTWREVAEELDEAAEHLDAAARLITDLASKQACVAADHYLIRKQPVAFGQMPETLEGLTKVAVEIGQVGARVHGWAENTAAYTDGRPS